uniref:Uncharacterized protein n=1 Tax=Oryza punctata TaxID=4537 RepID=A0A0E0JHC0_ORYPU
MNDCVDRFHLQYFLAGQTVSDNHGCPVNHHSVQRVLNHPFGFSIQCTGCFIQQKDLGVLNNRARDRDTLLLASRQLSSPLSNHCVIPLQNFR